MLNTLRNAASTWIAKLLLVLLVASFAFWGISGQIFSDMGRDVISAGRTSVSMLDYRLAYDRTLSVLSQQLGTRITREQAVAFGVDNQVLSELASGAVLDEAAREIGLGLSQDRLAELTASDPAFRGPDGRFDRQQFQFVLSQVGMRPEDYLKNREQVAIRQQIIEAVSDGMDAPQTFLRNLARYRGESRTIEFVPLPRSLVEPIEEPSDEELASYFEENSENYAAPEYRKIAYVKLEPEDIADPESVTDEQVREYYEGRAERYTQPEKRTIEQIVFPTEEEATAARESMRTGATFEDLVEMRDLSLEDAELGTFAKNELSDQALAEAAFALPEGGVSEVVEGTFGHVILRVTDVTPEQVTPMAEVADEIRNELALDEASRTLLDVYDTYEDARAGGATMKEAAERLGLEMQVIEKVDRNARDEAGNVISDLPASRDLLSEAFETDTGIENAPINLGANGYLFYEVEDIVPARERDLDEVRDQVVADWKEAEAASRLSERADELAQSIRSGTSLDAVAEEIGQEKQVKRGLKRLADDSDLGRDGVAAAFNVGPQGVGVFLNPAGEGRFLFKVTEVFAPAETGPDALPQDVVSSTGSAYANDLVQQLVQGLQQKYEVRVNRNAVEQAMSF